MIPLDILSVLCIIEYMDAVSDTVGQTASDRLDADNVGTKE